MFNHGEPAAYVGNAVNQRYLEHIVPSIKTFLLQIPNPNPGCDTIVRLARAHCKRAIAGGDWSRDIIHLVYWRCMSRDGVFFERPVGIDYK